MNDRWLPMTLAGLILGVRIACPVQAAELRRVVPLDGTWQIAEGAKDAPPPRFERTAPVPGLADMARPAFDNVGLKDDKREAFWYRRTFRLEGPLPAVARLKIHKAMFGSRVVLNGKDLGEHRPVVHARLFRRQGRAEGRRERDPRSASPRSRRVGTKSLGWDYEKTRFVPGIFDSVELILSGAPHIDRVQAVPDLQKQSVTVHVWPAAAGPRHRPRGPFQARRGRGRRRRAGHGRRCRTAGPGRRRTRSCTS